MNAAGVGEVLRAQLGSAAIGAETRTAVSEMAQDNLGMAAAYLQDGDSFLRSDDTVNALAAFCYGLGWLHCGAACGLFTLQAVSCPFREPLEPLRKFESEKLAEKTARYGRLLSTARGAIRPAAETGTVPFNAAQRLFCTMSAYAGQGNRYLASGSPEDALACFSYGHGWLDAAVRSGFFSVQSHREIFTL